jgi:hypothetical protein
MKIGSLVFCVLFALTNGAPLDGMGQCPDGSPNGAQIPRGRFVFLCQDGNIVPKGCLTDKLDSLEVGATFDRRQYRLRCARNGDELSFELVGCLLDGQEHKEGETFESGTSFYTCKRNGEELQLINLGCLDNGKRVNLNDRVVKDDLVMLCNTSVNNGAKLMPDGCAKDGKQYNVGGSFEVGRIWYKCERVGRQTVELKPAGCVTGGRRLNDGDRFVENEVAYECMIDSATHDIRVTACIQNENGQVIERKVGCFFNEGQEPFQYEKQCVADEKTKSAKKVFIRCKYNAGSSTISLEPGCYRVFEKSAFGCLKEGDGLKLQSFQGEKPEEAAKGAGLHAC